MVRILNFSRDERDGVTVIRGVIDPASLRFVKPDKYQREVLSDRKIGELMVELRTVGVPDVDLGMRGDRTQVAGPHIDLLDPVMIIDGLQRISAGLRLMDDEDPVEPYIGATIHLNTTPASEREMFDKRNIKGTRLSPNIHLRNKKDDVPALNALFRLTHDASFPLRNKVQWSQQPRRSDLLTATVYVKTIGRLHGHMGPTSAGDVLKVAIALDVVMQGISRPVLMSNVKDFFDVIDEAWKLRDVEYRGATVLKGGFLDVLARLFSDHENFWDGDRLLVTAPMLSKLSRFKVQDPQISQLAGSGGPSRDILYDRLVNHLDSGARRNHLQRRGRANGLVVDEVN